MVSLAEYVRAPARDAAFITQCEAAARARVDAALMGGSTPPPEVMKQALLEVGANLYARRVTTQDIAGMDGQLVAVPARPALNPLTPVLHLLEPYLPPGIA